MTEVKKEEEKSDMALMLEAVKELTTQIAKLNAEWEKWRKAGKF